MTNLQAGILGFAVAAAVAIVFFAMRRRSMSDQSRDVVAERDKILGEAAREAESLRREAQVRAKDEVLGLREEFERESREQRREIQSGEKRIATRELELERRAAAMQGQLAEAEQIGRASCRERV